MSMPDALVSVVVPSRGGAATLPRLFDTFAQQNDPNFEVVVVLDGDIDGSRAIVDAEQRFNVSALEFPENRGRVAALNAGFAQARGEILVRCDDDLLLPAGFIAAHRAAHAKAEAEGRSVGVVGPTFNVYEDTPYARAYGRGTADAALAHAYAQGPETAWQLWAANCSETRDTFDELGGYDTDYRHYGWEDVDHGYRVHASGREIVVCKDAQADHLGAAPDTLSRALRAYHSGAARHLFLEKHPQSGLKVAKPGPGIWGRAVGVTARLLNEKRTKALSRVVDALLPLLPAAIGRKMVALTVEAAGLAGNRRPSNVKERF
ncbi:glycosyltransferase family 2 protein [Dermabacteraceae bacterium P13115]